MKRNIMILTVTAALLSSCGIYNRYTPTDTVPADLYGFNVEQTDDSVSLGDMDWQKVFTDPHLLMLINQGLENNTDYQSAQLRVKEAEATLLSPPCFRPSWLSCLPLPFLPKAA